MMNIFTAEWLSCSVLIMTEIEVTTDVWKFMLNGVHSRNIAYDKVTDEHLKTFLVPVNMLPNEVTIFLDRYNDILRQSDVISERHQSGTDNIPWNDLIFLHHDLKTYWTSNRFSIQKKRSMRREFKHYLDFLGFIEESINDDCKLQFRCNEKNFYTIPSVKNKQDLLRSISNVLLSHLIDNAETFNTVMFQKGETLDFFKSIVEDESRLPDEPSPQFFTALVARELLNYVRNNRLIKSKVTPKVNSVMTEAEGRFIYNYITLFGLDNVNHKVNLRDGNDYLSFSDNLRKILKKIPHLR